MSRNFIPTSKVKKCSKCGESITFAKNRNGKWFAVDAFWDLHNEVYYYTSHIGNHKNLTPFHNCRKPDPVVEKPVKSAYEIKADKFSKDWFKLTREGKLEEAAELAKQFEAEARIEFPELFTEEK